MKLIIEWKKVNGEAVVNFDLEADQEEMDYLIDKAFAMLNQDTKFKPYIY